MSRFALPPQSKMRKVRTSPVGMKEAAPLDVVELKTGHKQWRPRTSKTSPIVVIVSAIAGIVLGIVSEMLGWGIMHN